MPVSDELARVAAIRERLARPGDDVVVGIGDDAAVLAPSGASQVLTVDVAVEGVHFRREWASLREIGRRAFVCAASDLAAMGARGRASLLALVLPRDLDDQALLELVAGVADGADETGARVVGGNLSAGAELSITTTVVGELDGAPLTRAGAQPGDGIYLTGDVGGAALGVALLERGRGDDERALPFVQRWRAPTALLQIGQRLRGVATAAIDVSDGVLSDLDHLCEASRVGARVHAAELPLPAALRGVAREVGLDPLDLALSGGDDYQLLFTAPAAKVARDLATRIGEIVPAERGRTVLDEDGRPRPAGRSGYRHFG